MLDPEEHRTEADTAFQFRLARDLHMTVAELRRRMSEREFREWVAFYNAEAKVRPILAKQAEANG